MVRSRHRPRRRNDAVGSGFLAQLLAHAGIARCEGCYGPTKRVCFPCAQAGMVCISISSLPQRRPHRTKAATWALSSDAAAAFVPLSSNTKTWVGSAEGLKGVFAAQRIHSSPIAQVAADKLYHVGVYCGRQCWCVTHVLRGWTACNTALPSS